MSSSMQDFNQRIIDEFRANGGETDMFESLLLLHHRGAKSGEDRITPLVYMADDGRYVIFASKAGAPTNPDWYHNLKAHPEITIEIGTETIRARAEEVTGEERDRLFKTNAERNPGFKDYQEKTDRVIPVIALTPEG